MYSDMLPVSIVFRAVMQSRLSSLVFEFPHMLFVQLLYTYTSKYQRI